MQGKLTIRGHTDALPYKDGIVGNNWSLSAGRAEATRQALMRDGIAERPLQADRRRGRPRTADPG